RPIEHLAGQLDVLDLRVPLRSKDGRYGLVLCFALEGVPLDRLGAELIRVSHPDGAIWLVVWKKGLLREGASSWNEAQQAMLETGWVDNKILSLGEEVYATRYVRRRRPRPRSPCRAASPTRSSGTGSWTRLAGSSSATPITTRSSGPTKEPSRTSVYPISRRTPPRSARSSATFASHPPRRTRTIKSSRSTATGRCSTRSISIR